MHTYLVEYQKKSLVNDSPPHGPYKFNVDAKDIYAAAKKAVPELVKIGFLSDLHDVWNAQVIDLRDPVNAQQILRRGSWLVDLKTGKPLEKRV